MLEQFKTQEAVAAKQVTAFEKGLPAAKVVRIPNADHFVFVSNEADVLREMNAFIAGLAK
jgi:non-heme chloroperoxidase